MSRIGRKPIVIPKDVKIEVKDGVVFAESTKGKLNRKLPEGIELEIKDNQVFLRRRADTSEYKSLQGLSRALIFNMLEGLSQGYTKELEIIGVGYKAQVQANALNMQLGFSHPVVFSIPEGIKISCPKPTQVVVSGIDKEKVGKVASEVRAVYPPEPYKGKGIRFVGEYVKKKIGKAAQTASK